MKEIHVGVNGVKISGCDGFYFVSIEDFSDEMKERLRKRLSEICWGPTANGSSLVAESYQKTMNSLKSRIKKKADTTKMGMVGELLTHLFLADQSLGFVSVNRMFNLEESSIKKGFDLVLQHQEQGELHLVEVKSSAIDADNIEGKILNLFKICNSDMDKKLNSPADNLWNNALSHCSSALRKTDLRDTIEDVLEKLRDDALTLPTSESHNVIFSAIGFQDTSNLCCSDKLHEMSQNYDSWGSYKSITFFGLEKRAYEAVLEFIDEEAD